MRKPIFGGVLLVMLSGLTPAHSANLVGDADNSGQVHITDSALIMRIVLGLEPTDQASPLGYANNDGVLDLRDIMLIGHAYWNLRTLTGETNLFSVGVTPDLMVPSSYSSILVGPTVTSNYPLSRVDGLDLTFSLPVNNGEATVVSPVAVISGVGDTDFTPISSNPLEGVSILWDLTIRDSDGGAVLEQHGDTIDVTITAPICGDGVVAPSELCDDGANNGTLDGYCDSTCSAIQGCGDSMTNGIEVCDDGPVLGEGACLNDCTGTQICGNSVTNGSEGCDDGNTISEGPGFCTGDCASVQICGDGTANGTETCDDGPLNGAGDGQCLDDCTGVQVCGDGVINGSEVCDDTTNNGVTYICSGIPFYARNHQYCIFETPTLGIIAPFNCEAEGAAGYTATISDDFENSAIDASVAALSTLLSFWIGYSDEYGEGFFVWANGEIPSYENWATGSPDGGMVENCTTMFTGGEWDDQSCFSTQGYVCEFELGFCNGTCDEFVCGDGMSNGGEFCDDGPNNGAGTGYCNADCSARLGCGDGAVQGEEICDDGVNNGLGEGFCLTDCTRVQFCGDGMAEGTEQCDDGVSAGDDDCRNNCTFQF